jgi:hypothetical protein
MRSKRVAAVASFLGLAALAGCSSLLGDFEVGPATGNDGGPPQDGTVGGDGSPHPDGSQPQDGRIDSPLVNDAPITDQWVAPDVTEDTPATIDSPPDVPLDVPVDAPPPMLSCSTWKHTTPIIVDDGVVSTSYGMLFPVNTQYGPRVFGATQNAATPVAMFTIDPGTSQVTSVVATSPANVTGTTVTAFHHVFFNQFDYGVMGLGYAYPIGQSWSDWATNFVSDTQPANGNISNFSIFYTPASATFQPVTNMAMVPFADNDIFGIFAYQDTVTPADYTLAVGRTPINPSTVGTSVNSNSYLNLAGYHANSKVYIFSEDGVAPEGVTTWTVPETGTVTTLPTPRQVSSGLLAFIADIAPSASLLATNVVFFELANPNNFSVNIRVGQIANSQLDTWVSTDLPLYANADATLEPFPAIGNIHPYLYGDDVMLIGSGGLPADGGNISNWLNMVWVDVYGHIRAQRLGSSGIFVGSTTNIGALQSFPLNITPTSAQWGFFWTQTVNNPEGGTYQQLLYNELDCQ